ncbi:MAG: ABC transporter permease, partial [Thermofilaceae archaeon]
MQLRRGGSSPSTSRSPLRPLLQELRAAASVSVRIYLRYPAWLVADIVTTPAWLVLFILPILLFLPREQWSNPQTLTMLFWGWIFWDIVSAGLWNFGNAIRREQQMGTLEFLMLTNASRAILFSRDIFSRIVSLALSLTYVYAFFTLLFNVKVVVINPVGVALSLLIGLFTAMGFGLLYGALVLRFKQVGPLNSILQFIILGLSGAFFPVTALPEGARVVALALPFTYSIDLLRHYSMGTPTLLPVTLEFVVLISYTALLLALGISAVK